MRKTFLFQIIMKRFRNQSFLGGTPCAYCINIWTKNVRSTQLYCILYLMRCICFWLVILRKHLRRQLKLISFCFFFLIIKRLIKHAHFIISTRNVLHLVLNHSVPHWIIAYIRSIRFCSKASRKLCGTCVYPIRNITHLSIPTRFQLFAQGTYKKWGYIKLPDGRSKLTRKYVLSWISNESAAGLCSKTLTFIFMGCNLLTRDSPSYHSSVTRLTEGHWRYIGGDDNTKCKNRYSTSHGCNTLNFMPILI